MQFPPVTAFDKMCLNDLQNTPFTIHFGQQEANATFWEIVVNPRFSTKCAGH